MQSPKQATRLRDTNGANLLDRERRRLWIAARLCIDVAVAEVLIVCSLTRLLDVVFQAQLIVALADVCRHIAGVVGSAALHKVLVIETAFAVDGVLDWWVVCLTPGDRHIEVPVAGCGAAEDEVGDFKGIA